MRKIGRATSAGVALAAAFAELLCPCGAEGQETTVTYHGLRPTDPGGRDGLRNPERGLRIETLIAELPGDRTWGPAAHLVGRVPATYSDDWWILDAAHYERDGLTLAQTYCYLDRYPGQPVPQEKLDALQRAFDALRAHGLKAVLRFAYERDMGLTAGPTCGEILAHLAQLTPIIRANADVVFVLQAGFVGAWGEWHSSAHQVESDHAQLAAIVAAVLDALPADRCTQVRVPKYKRWVLEPPVLGGFEEVTAATAHSATPAARLGFHNDGFLAGETDGGTWPEAPLYGRPGNPEFDSMTRESAFVPVDGELFWSDQGGVCDGLEAAAGLCLHHYSSFSLAHSCSDREGKPYAIDRWRQTPITPEQLREARLPASDGYFGDDAQPVEQTQYEYIRDHLGYRLELQRATYPARVPAGGAAPVRLELVNRGFSTLHNPRPVLVVLIGPEGRLAGSWATDADPRSWQPYEPGDETRAPLTHTIQASVEVPADLAPGMYQLGLWLPDAAESLRLDPRYAIRVANRDVPWWTDAEGHYGLNILGTITVGG